MTIAIGHGGRHQLTIDSLDQHLTLLVIKEVGNLVDLRQRCIETPSARAMVWSGERGLEPLDPAGHTLIRRRFVQFQHRFDGITAVTSSLSSLNQAIQGAATLTVMQQPLLPAGRN